MCNMVEFLGLCFGPRHFGPCGAKMLRPGTPEDLAACVSTCTAIRSGGGSSIGKYSALWEWRKIDLDSSLLECAGDACRRRCAIS